MNTTINQYAEFIYSIYIGIVIALFFDFIKLLRINQTKIVNKFLDLAFWAGAFIFAFKVMMKINALTLRVYILIGMLIGIIIYFISLSKIINKLITSIKKIFKALSVKLAEMLE